MNKWMKKLTAALCAAVLMCGMAVTAYAGGGEEWSGLDPAELNHLAQPRKPLTSARASPRMATL